MKMELLEGKNPANELDLKEIFCEITKSHDFTFIQFVEHLRRKRFNYSIVHYDYFFRHFDRRMSERIDFAIFHFVMNEAF